jgi:hypothetical protein
MLGTSCHAGKVTDTEAPAEMSEHRMNYRRFEGHMTSVWCSCGWTIANPTRLIRRADIERTWREHLAG